MKTDSLAMLTPQDFALLNQQMAPMPFRRGAVLLQEGVQRRALFIVRSGSVRVERLAQGRSIVLAQLGAGEVLGEIGFVENAPASASVVAQEACVVDVIEGDALQSLIAAEPGFAARFYHSLAVSLARRTRAADLARMVHAGTGAAAQVNRFHAPHTGNITTRQIPAGLSEGLAAFERAMMAARQVLRTGEPMANEQRRVDQACNSMVDLLRTYTVDDTLVDMGYSDLLSFRDPAQLEAGVGDCIFRETFGTLMLSATMARCYAKPRGFPDDFETMAAIHRDTPEGDDRLGPLIDRWFLARPLCRSRRASAGHVRGMLASLATSAAAGTELRAANLASGAATELFDFFADHPKVALVVTCVDLDEEALLAGARQAESAGLGERVAFLHGNAVPSGGRGVSLLTQDLVYALGLCEYLVDDEVVALLDFSHAVLAPGGSVVLTQLASSNPDRELMAHLLDWKAHHRSSDDLLALFTRSAFADEPVRLKLDEAQVTIIAHCTKADE